MLAISACLFSTVCNLFIFSYEESHGSGENGKNDDENGENSENGSSQSEDESPKAKSMLYTSVDNFKLNEVLNYMVHLTKIDN